MLYHIYTDGSCDNNDTRSGSFGYIVVNPTINQILSEFVTGVENTTSNRMEQSAVMMAMCHALSDFPIDTKFIVYSDSQYVIHTMKGYYKKFKNLDLWFNMDLLKDKLKDRIQFEWIRGHSGNKWNSYIDKKCSYKLNK